MPGNPPRKPWEGCRRIAEKRIGSGGRIRTYDLRVMSPTSYQTAPPRTGKRRHHTDAQVALARRLRGHARRARICKQMRLLAQCRATSRPCEFALHHLSEQAGPPLDRFNERDRSVLVALHFSF